MIPQIGGIKVKELTADQLDDWLDERAEELSTRSLRLIHQIVERAIRQAEARRASGPISSGVLVANQGPCDITGDSWICPEMWELAAAIPKTAVLTGYG